MVCFSSHPEEGHPLSLLWFSLSPGWPDLSLGMQGIFPLPGAAPEDTHKLTSSLEVAGKEGFSKVSFTFSKL